jgi:hypothetical protein
MLSSDSMDSPPTGPLAEPEPERKATPKTFEDIFENNLLHYYVSSYANVRQQQAAYFEKLALLDAGAVTLTVTAVLGSLHGNVTHRHALQAGLCALVIALLILLARNFVWTKYEAMAVDVRYEKITAKGWDRLDKISDVVGWLGAVGVLFTAIGMLLLVRVALSLF